MDEFKGIAESDKGEFIGQLIDIFEDFLEEKGIEIENPEKEESDDPAIIYGSDYGALQQELESMMRNWGIIKC